MSRPEFLYCYHCGRQHPSAEMRQIETRGGRKWRCVKSIEATKIPSAERDAFGKAVTMINKAEHQARVKARLDAERLLGQG